MRKQFRPSQFVLREQEIKIIVHSTRSFRDRVIIKTLYYAGLRRAEARDLKVGDIDFQRRRLTVTCGKFSKVRTLPLINFEHIGDLKHLIGKRTDGFIFCKGDGSELTTRMINHIVQRAGEKAGIKHPNPNYKHINPHLFRHSIARHLKSMGFPLEWVQNFLGHDNIGSTADSYGTLGLEEMQRMADKKLGLLAPTNQETLDKIT